MIGYVNYVTGIASCTMFSDDTLGFRNIDLMKIFNLGNYYLSRIFSLYSSATEFVTRSDYSFDLKILL